ncbi:MAG: M28 family peptidase, partial [Gammaproteobacteria bacterium]|nr:M28 family peptidase [Gammaproteobacteria bacterium]
FAEHYIVVSAHYDHLGQRGNRIYYGANDNASGVSTMLALMRHFSKTPAHYSFIFIATDAEEDGLYGAKYFVENPPIALSSITLNINLDMIGDGNRKRRLYIAGTKEYPLLKAFFQPILEQLSSTKVKLVLGHDGFARLKPFSSERINWKRASDHFAFNNKGIAYLYFGTDSNTTYHTPNDRVERIDRAFFIEATTTILKITEALQQLAPEQIKQHN